jgi:hypothetical protein
MSGAFLRRGDELVEMAEQQYALEGDLQELIERHPSVGVRQRGWSAL